MRADWRSRARTLWPADQGSALRSVTERSAAAVFGDSVGLVIFLGALLFFGAYWRIGLFITDNWTIADTLVAVADGHLYLEGPVHGPPDVRTPGLHYVDGRVYGRNYGQVFLALPFLGAVELLALLTDLRIAIAGGWSLLLLAFSTRMGALLDQRDEFVVLGSAGALLAFIVNVAVARPLPPETHYVLALQLLTMVAAGLVGVILYRLLARMHDARTGVFVGGATVLATPIAFWASVPKRHVLMAVLFLAVFYAFYVSREAEDDRRALLAMSLAYGFVGLAAWTHAPEALLVLVVLLPIDLVTARSNSRRDLAVVGGVFVVSLLPFLATNLLIAGNPLVPPRFIEAAPAPSVAGGGPHSPSTPAEGLTSSPVGAPLPPPTAQEAAAPSSPGDGGTPSVSFGLFVDIWRATLASLATLVGLMERGIDVATVHPSNLYHTFIRSSPATTRATTVDLSVLESSSIFGVFVVLPILLLARLRDAGLSAINRSAERQLDVLAIAVVVAFTLLYLHRMPLQTSYTIRYMVPMVPIGMYGVGRIRPVRAVLHGDARLLVYAYAAQVLIGGQLLVVYLIALDPTRGEVFRFHAVLGIVAAVAIGSWAVGHELEVVEDPRIGAIAVSVPLAVGTLFVLLTGMEYLVLADFALGMTQLVSDAVPLF